MNEVQLVISCFESTLPLGRIVGRLRFSRAADASSGQNVVRRRGADYLVAKRSAS